MERRIGRVGAIQELPLPRPCLVLVNAFWAIHQLPRAYGGTCLSGPFPRGRIIDFVSVLAGTTSVPLRGSMDGVKGVAPMFTGSTRTRRLVEAIHELPLVRRCLELVSVVWGD